MDSPIAETLTTVPASSLITLTVNGIRRELEVMPWVTPLDLLRERLQLTGTKKGATTVNAERAPSWTASGSIRV